ncbi:hypothetical protein BMS3Abin15_00378 [bacterium BMS3Abin15]|nr:hypothetical protein BMS3Abin15_00378 [bacterium BMS3Abin15]
MGLLFLDVTPKGIIMGSDSNDVIIYDNRLKVSSEKTNKEKVIRIQISNFKGLLGYVGTEKIRKTQIRNWLESFRDRNENLNLAEFCDKLADELSKSWRKYRLKSGLWIFVSGFEKKEERFYYINNIGHLDTNSGLYSQISYQFKAVNDLDDNYIRPRLRSGIIKKDILRKTIFNFRNGAIVPFAQIYEKYNEILKILINTGDGGFKKLNRLEKYSFIARQRLEFIKRLYSKKHGIYKREDSIIGKGVSVYAVDKKGYIYECSKNKYQKVN